MSQIHCPNQAQISSLKFFRIFMIAVMSFCFSLATPSFAKLPAKQTKFKTQAVAKKSDLSVVTTTDNLSPTERLLADPSIQPALSEGYSSSLLYNAKAFNNLSGSYQQMVKDREAKRAFNLQTNESEMTYYDQNKSMVVSYLKTLGRSRLLEVFRAATRGVRDDADRQKRAQASHPTPVVQENKVNLSSPKGRKAKGVASAVAKGHNRGIRVATQSTAPEQNDEAAETAGQAFQTVWNVGHNLLQNYQRIGFAALGEGRLHYDLQQNAMQFKLLTGLFDSEIRYRVSSNPLPMTGVRSSFGGDRAVMSLSRGFEPLQLSTGVTYGMQSKSMGCSLSKRLLGPLSAQYEHTMNLQDPSLVNDTFQVNVGLGF